MDGPSLSCKGPALHGLALTYMNGPLLIDGPSLSWKGPALHGHILLGHCWIKVDTARFPLHLDPGYILLVSDFGWIRVGPCRSLADSCNIPTGS